ncbi:MAG: c-type cytochrome [Pseudohongiellaceae bacterium]
MKKSVFLSAACLGTLLSALSLGAMAQGDAVAGQTKAALCASCHGPDGNSPLAMNPKLAGQNASYLVKQLQDFKSGERPGPIMAPMAAGLSEQDMQDIAAFYAGQDITLEGADPVGVDIAETLYRAGNKEISVAACSACHSPSGTGNAPAGFPAVGGQHAEYTLAQLRAFRSGERSNDDNGVMQDVVARLTDRELEVLANYLSGLH